MRIVKTDVPCPKCKKMFKTDFYRNVEINENEEIYKKIKDKSIFKWSCPECGTNISTRYPFICYDKKNKFAILIKPVSDEKEPSIEEINDTLRMLEVDPIDNIENYKKRTVTTLEDLNEKIEIFKEDLNDAIVEFAKRWFIGTSNVKIDELRFYKIKDDFIEWIVCYDGQIKGARLPMDFYRESIEDWKVNIPDNFPIVKASNLENYLTRITPLN